MWRKAESKRGNESESEKAIRENMAAQWRKYYRRNRNNESIESMVSAKLII
jgi:hypothetical protein